MIQLGVADDHGDIPVIHDSIHKNRTVFTVYFHVEAFAVFLVYSVKKLFHFRVIFVIFPFFRFVGMGYYKSLFVNDKAIAYAVHIDILRNDLYLIQNNIKGNNAVIVI